MKIDLVDEFQLCDKSESCKVKCESLMAEMFDFKIKFPLETEYLYEGKLYQKVTPDKSF